MDHQLETLPILVGFNLTNLVEEGRKVPSSTINEQFLQCRKSSLANSTHQLGRILDLPRFPCLKVGENENSPTTSSIAGLNRRFFLSC
jgi:hypothetical protein